MCVSVVVFPLPLVFSFGFLQSVQLQRTGVLCKYCPLLCPVFGDLGNPWSPLHL